MKYLLLLTMAIAAAGFTSCAHRERVVSTSTTETTHTVAPVPSATVRTY